MKNLHRYPEIPASIVHPWTEEGFMKWHKKKLIPDGETVTAFSVRNQKVGFKFKSGLRQGGIFTECWRGLSQHSLLSPP